MTNFWLYLQESLNEFALARGQRKQNLLLYFSTEICIRKKIKNYQIYNLFRIFVLKRLFNVKAKSCNSVELRNRL